jgi:hypothetical protein
MKKKPKAKALDSKKSLKLKFWTPSKKGIWQLMGERMLPTFAQAFYQNDTIKKTICQKKL